ncbi:hypothetical protein AN901_204899 [Pseudomonas syringae pv. theae]|nr:hypothetical protein AN901_204899 [Pseudomonas syringae pv. theae]
MLSKGGDVPEIQGAGPQFVIFLCTPADSQSQPKFSLAEPQALTLFFQALTHTSRNVHFFDHRA